MTDWLLVAIIVLLILNGDWPDRARVFVSALSRRWCKTINRRIKNYRKKLSAQRGQK